MIEIAIITHKIIRNDGQGRVNFEVAKAAAARCKKVYLISAEVAPEILMLPNVRWIKVTHGPFPTAILRNLWFSFGSSSALRRIRDPKLLVVTNGAVTLSRSDINAAHFVHSGWLKSEYNEFVFSVKGIYQRFYTYLNSKLERMAFGRSESIVAVSSRIFGELIQINIDKGRVHVVHNGVDEEEFKPGASDRIKLGLPDNKVIVLFVGDIATDRKNLGLVMRAAIDLPEVHLVVVGDDRKTPFVAEAQRLGIASRVQFMGFRRDVGDLMRASDIFVLPSRYEPWGLVVVEAMATGLPVIVSKNVGAAEIIKDGEGIVLEDPNNVEQLNQALRRLVSSRDLRMEIGQRAYEKARQYSWKIVAGRYVDIFYKIAQKDKGS